MRKTATPTYVTRERWSTERPESLVVCCSDGRYHGAIEEFVHAQVSERPDVFAVPGGPASIDAWASSFDHARVFGSSFELLLTSHALKSVWLIAHKSCAFYRHRLGPLAENSILDRQIEDLARARRLLLERRPAIAVHLIYATPDALSADSRVRFEELEGDDSEESR